MDSAPAFAMDKPFAPSAVRGPEPPENPQSRKNFSVSHLLDLEEVAAGMNGTPPAGPPPAGSGKAVPEPSGGSSGSEAAPQDGECRRPGMGHPGLEQFWDGVTPSHACPRAGLRSTEHGEQGGVGVTLGGGHTDQQAGGWRRGVTPIGASCGSGSTRTAGAERSRPGGLGHRTAGRESHTGMERSGLQNTERGDRVAIPGNGNIASEERDSCWRREGSRTLYRVPDTVDRGTATS